MKPDDRMSSHGMPASGWGGDIAGFTDMQWYMYHSHNIAHFAAFSAAGFDRPGLRDLARALMRQAPQLSTGTGAASSPDDLPASLLDRLVSLETVDSLDGYPAIGLNAGDDLLEAPDLPLFRIRVAILRNGADNKGRRAYFQVRVNHALVEGMDSALLTRSRPAAHIGTKDPPFRKSPLLPSLVGGLAAYGHLLAGNLYQPHPGPFAHATSVVDRQSIGRMARNLGVRQRAVLFAIVLALLFDQGSPHGKAKVSCTYSTIDSRAVARDRFMRMRMLFAAFANKKSLAALARAVDARLTETELGETGFSAAMNAAAIAMHRRLSRRLGFAYRPQLFQFMPFDIIIGLIPPHRLDGALTKNLIEPVYAGAGTPGGNGCVIVPNRDCFTFNFYLQEKLLPAVPKLTDLLTQFEHETA